MKQQGLTLAELLAGLALAGILAALASPAFSELIESQRRQDAARQLDSGVRSARVEAIQRGQSVVIEALEGDWSNGWQVFVDSNQNQFRDDDETLLVARASETKVRIAGNRNVAARVVFDNAGRPLNGTGNGTLGVCRKDQYVSQHQVVVAVTGRVRLLNDQFTTEPCA